jgi:hypothetical protein
MGGDPEWPEANVLVRDGAGDRRLWLTAAGALHDAIGPVRMYEQGSPAPVEVCELAVFVAEWVTCAAERDGPVAYRDIRPDLRALVYELTPTAIAVSDDDAVDFVLS